MVEELVRVRNDYVGILEPLVYKIELLLHEMSKLSKLISKQVNLLLCSTKGSWWNETRRPIKMTDNKVYITSIAQ